MALIKGIKLIQYSKSAARSFAVTKFHKKHMNIYKDKHISFLSYVDLDKSKLIKQTKIKHIILRKNAIDAHATNVSILYIF